MFLLCCALPMLCCFCLIRHNLFSYTQTAISELLSEGHWSPKMPIERWDRDPFICGIKCLHLRVIYNINSIIFIDFIMLASVYIYYLNTLMCILYIYTHTHLHIHTVCMYGETLFLSSEKPNVLCFLNFSHKQITSNNNWRSPCSSTMDPLVEDPCSGVMYSLLCETMWVEATELFFRKYQGKQQPTTVCWQSYYCTGQHFSL